MKNTFVIVLILLLSNSISFAQDEILARVDPLSNSDASQTTVEQISNEDLMQVLKKSDIHRGGHIPGIFWDLKVDNVEQGSLKEQVFLLIEASTKETDVYALAHFLEPKNYTGQKILVRGNNMWFAKPGLRKPVAISSRQRLSGTAANADITATNYFHDYSITSSDEVKHNNEDCWLLELDAVNNLVSYPKIKYWISKEKGVGLKTEFYGKSGKMIKSADFEYKNKITFESKDYSFMSKVVIYDNINQNDKTTLYVKNIKIEDFDSSKFQKDTLMD